jgi:hypothetical protein
LLSSVLHLQESRGCQCEQPRWLDMISMPALSG